MKRERGDFRKGMTRVEVVVVIALIAALAIMLFPALTKSKAKRSRSTCIGNLRQVGLGFRQWAIGSDSEFPMNVSTNRDFHNGTQEYIQTREMFRHFQALSNDLNTPKVLVCPSDVRQPAKDFATLRNSNISYFIGLDATETSPSMILAGDRNLTNGTLLPNGILELKSNSVIGWTDKMHNGQGNVLLSDGSVQALSRLRNALQPGGDATNRLAMPVD